MADKKLKNHPIANGAPPATPHKPLMRRCRARLTGYWHRNWWHKFVLIASIAFLIILGFMYGIAKWYQLSQRSTPYTMGVTFVPDYAQSLGLNPNATMNALMNDMHVKNFRLVSYWSDIEPSPGRYDFEQLDSEFQQADAAHAHILLVVGLRQPRWPECHPPSWVNTAAPERQWEPQLEQFMTTVVNRYKDNPALSSYQVENEYFLKGFGDCQNFDRNRLVSEYNLVKKLDPNHPIIVSRSNNAIGFPIGAPTPNEYGLSLYRRVWNTFVFHTYLEYPFPSWYYAFLAGMQEIYQHRNTIIAEMQAEAWPPHGQTIPQTSLAEQNKSLNAKRLQGVFTYAHPTGIRTVYF